MYQKPRLFYSSKVTSSPFLILIYKSVLPMYDVGPIPSRSRTWLDEQGAAALQLSESGSRDADDVEPLGDGDGARSDAGEGVAEV